MVKKKYDKCPHCGGTHYYTKTYVRGVVPYNYSFKTNMPGDNTDMYDYLNTERKSDYIYCLDCNKRICKREELDISNSPFNSI